MPIIDKTPINRTDTETAADKLAEEVKSSTKTLRSMRRELSPLELNRMNIGRKVRRSSWNPGSEDYSELKKIRQEIAAKRLKVINLEKALVRAKSSLYSMNIALRQNTPLSLLPLMLSLTSQQQKRIK